MSATRTSCVNLSFLFSPFGVAFSFYELYTFYKTGESGAYLLYNYTQRHLMLFLRFTNFITGESGAYLSNYTLTLEKDALTGRPDWGESCYNFN